MKKNRFLLMTGMIASTLLLGACSQVVNIAKEDTQVFEYIKDGTVVFGEDMKPVLAKDIPATNENIVDWIFDPYCPACVKLEEIMKDKTFEITKDNDLLIRYYPSSFLSASSNNYSEVAASYILSVAENVPDKAFEYLANTMTEEFHPGQEDFDGTDDRFINLMKLLEISEEDIEEIKRDEKVLREEVKKSTRKLYNSAGLLEKTVDGRLSVPMVIVGNEDKMIDFSTALDVEEHFMNSILSYRTRLSETATPSNP